MKKPIAIPILILILFALLFCATMVGVSLRSQKSTWNDEMIMTGGNKVYEKTYQVQPDGKLIIDADVGDIIITGSDKNEVTISVTARGSEEKLKRFSVSSSQEGNTIRIDGKMKRQYLNMFGENTPNVRFDVQVPKVYNLRLNTSGGDIALEDIKGSLEGETSGGDLDLRHLEGKVRMNTSGGNVNLKSSEGDFVLETSGGNIELQNCDGKVFASTSGGNIHAALKDNKGVELSTSGGNLSVRLPKTISADVNADASGGDVSCDFPFSGKLREGTLRGKINGGGNVIRLETSGGDIVINSLE